MAILGNEPKSAVPSASRVAVIGAGTMGSGIATSFAQAGYSVLLTDRSSVALDRALVRINDNLTLLKEFNVLDRTVDDTLGHVHIQREVDGLVDSGDLGLIIETVTEDLQIKRQLFEQLDTLPERIILASNTSSLTLTDITQGMLSAHRTVGLHYFNPAHVIPLVEVHRGARTSDETVQRARQLVETSGKLTVLVRKALPGLVINRLTGALEREIDFLLDEEVITPAELDQAVKASLGFRLACMGPMEAEDMIGLDVAARVSANLFKELSNAVAPSSTLLQKVSKGELGIKAGRGWYEYPEGQIDLILERQMTRMLRQLALFHAFRSTGSEK